MSQQHIHFLTGKLAENALRKVLNELSVDVGFKYSIQTMPITVAALMSVDWVAKKIVVPPDTDRVILPGNCSGDLEKLQQQLGVTVERGPKDLRMLDRFFGAADVPLDLQQHRIQIFAEVNHVPKMSVRQFATAAHKLVDDGADVIDIGCVAGQPCSGIADYVKTAVDMGLRVSIDSMDVTEISAAVKAGAEYVLSVNSSNIESASDWGCCVVVVPDEIDRLDSMQETIRSLSDQGIDFMIDPILEPIGTGLAASLNRYWQARKRWPEAAMMMGIGNLTELTDVDSAGVNFLLLGICEELQIENILTTQVINWARSSVREIDIARRLVHFAVQNQIPPKNLSKDLVCLRDPSLLNYDDQQLQELAHQIKDNNYRIFLSDEQLNLIGSQLRLSGKDPFEIFDALDSTGPKNLTASHAFYLGYELSKAMTAMQLGKNYVQDESLDWGHLTVPETNRHRLSRRYRRGDSDD